MAKKKDNIPRLYVRKGATMREIYKKAREEFTAADLAAFTEVEEGIPVAKVLAELEEIHRKESQKMKKKTK